METRGKVRNGTENYEQVWQLLTSRAREPPSPRAAAGRVAPAPSGTDREALSEDPVVILSIPL